MIVRKFLLGPLLLLSAFAHAQSDGLAAARPIMAEAMGELRTLPTLHIALTGKRTEGSRIVERFVVLTSLRRITLEATELVQVEQSVWENDALRRRTVGDGVTLWNFDPIARTYSALPYGRDGNFTPAHYQSRLFNGLLLRSTGPASFVNHLLAEVHGFRGLAPETIATSWLPWLRHATVVFDANRIACLTPAAELSYFILPPQFAGDIHHLMGAAYVEDTLLGQYSWEAAVFSELPSDADFSFAPPRDARPLVLQDRQIDEP